MWPKFLDLSSETCSGILRRLELEAYSSVVTAFRAQGDLTKERRKVLSDLSTALNISVERHKSEVRRAVNDELLATVAATVAGQHSEAEWAREGRRIIPLLRRATPINAFSGLANEYKLIAENHNRSLKSPLETRTPKRAGINAVKARRHADENGGTSDLADMVVRMENGDVRVRPPPVAVPPLPPKFRAMQEYFGGDCDVVILPSGGAVRIKNSLVAAEAERDLADRKYSASGGRRKRKFSDTPETDSYLTSGSAKTLMTSPAYELYPPGWQNKLSPGRLSTSPQHHQQQLQHHQGMPPPSAGAVARKPTSGRGSRRGQGGTLRARKARTLTKGEAVALSQAAVDAAYQQQQHQVFVKTSHPDSVDHRDDSSAVFAVTSSSGSNMTSTGSASPISGGPKISVVSSTSGVSCITTSASGVPRLVQTIATTQRQNIMTYSGAMALTNIPQMITAAFANGTPASVGTPTKQNTLEGGSNTSGTPRLAASTSTVTKSKSEDIPTSSSSSSTATPTSTATITTAVSTPTGLKTVPAGTRILPKPGGGPLPIFMVTGQNVMRLTRPVMDEATAAAAASSGVKVVTSGRMITATNVTGGQAINFSVPQQHQLQQRVVTVSGGALRPGMTAVRPSGLTRMVQPRVLTSPAGAGLTVKPSAGGSSDKPSVIVVQKGPGGKTIFTKQDASAFGQRLMASKVTTSNISKPIVIMSKPASLISASASEHSSTQQGNVIVLDLSQESGQNSAAGLSDLLQASGFLTGSGSGESDTGNHDLDALTGSRHPQQILLQHRVSEKVDSNELPWNAVGSDENHQHQDHHQQQADERRPVTRKEDIFSAAVASAQIEDFANDSVEITNSSVEPNGSGCLNFSESDSSVSDHNASAHHNLPTIEDISHDPNQESNSFPESIETIDSA